ncbi:ABC transporter permease [Bacillus aquiflavi]|uniref:ABC transporter permease n=1 Tax=Bacillus aquiflavi TaxID=2672567 RepID=A0A6B3VVA1_9BACI|nr:ABC transporter permease [Bacillus aquiflavi]MBA4536821.1 ABC transporter permease [Bacillus aquiflavi]NEY81188.1 ABC transporter permease [Bacillus aquiflavi]UAC49749.1 ABC transporter permease [Bacillus aquiflavi]
MNTKSYAYEVPDKKSKINRRLYKNFVDFYILARIQWGIIRDTWYLIVFMASMFPLAALFFLKVFNQDASIETITRIIVGNIVFAIVLMGLTSVAQDISHEKNQGHFIYYASLPISKITFILSVLLKGVLSAIPSILILTVIGQYMYGITFKFHIGLIPIILFGILSCVGVGVLIGFWAKTPQVAAICGQVAMMFITFMSPVMVEITSLPLLIQYISYLLPTTYLSEALRSLFQGEWSVTVTQDLVVLILFSLFSILLIIKFIKWRESD